VWDPAATGPASTGFVVNVSGPIVASLPTTDRSVSGAAPPGAYTVIVIATNPCGSSAPAAPQTISVP
jgi:hypothetical protein